MTVLSAGISAALVMISSIEKEAVHLLNFPVELVEIGDFLDPVKVQVCVFQHGVLV